MDCAENGLFVSTGLAPLVIRQFKTLGGASGVPSVPLTSKLSKVTFEMASKSIVIKKCVAACSCYLWETRHSP